MGWFTWGSSAGGGGSPGIIFLGAAPYPSVGFIRVGQNAADPATVIASHQNGGADFVVLQTYSATAGAGAQGVVLGSGNFPPLAADPFVALTGASISVSSFGGFSVTSGGTGVQQLNAADGDFIQFGPVANATTLYISAAEGAGEMRAENVVNGTRILDLVICPVLQGTHGTQINRAFKYWGNRNGDGTLLTIPIGSGHSSPLRLDITARAITAGGGAVGDTRRFVAECIVKNVGGTVSVPNRTDILGANGAGDGSLSALTITLTPSGGNLVVSVSKNTATASLDWAGDAVIPLEN